LLGGEILSRCYSYSGNEDYRSIAMNIMEAACSLQKDDGSWVYGLLPIQSWIDSYHTGYNLKALASYEKYTGDNRFHKFLISGYQFYINNFLKRMELLFILSTVNIL
jgi:hypothetical protein